MKKLPLFQKGRSGGMTFEHRKSISSGIFFYGFSICILIFFSILGLRLFQLTIVKGEYYRRLSEQNRIRELIIEPKRGKIIDRKGFVLAENKAADTTKNADRLTSARTYNNPEVIAPIVGYRQTADADDLKNDPCINKLRNGDKVGKKGIEKIFECQLRGREGKKLIEVDAKGSYIRTLSLLPPQDGETIQLSLDLELQKKAYEMIKDTKAAVVASNPKTGEILVFASSPSFNPQYFEDADTAETTAYFTNKDKPLFNRVTEATYPPGSIFKLVLATGALEEKKIDEKYEIEDTGTLKAGPLSFGNWYFLQYGKTDGMVNITKAIQRSNDIFFYKTGDLLTPARIKVWAERFGFGAPSGIEFQEATGLIPSEFWKEEKLDEQWFLGDTYNLSIGQGYLLVTPLQVSRATAALANGGNLCKPQLLKLSEDQTNKIECTHLPISQKTLDLVHQGMLQACAPGGTGWPLFEFKPQTACKTGTAESRGKDTLPHAWFTVYAPADNPEIELTVLIEEAGQGSDVAGPVAKEILKTYFERSQ